MVGRPSIRPSSKVLNDLTIPKSALFTQIDLPIASEPLSRQLRHVVFVANNDDDEPETLLMGKLPIHKAV